MSKLTNITLLALALTALPAVAADIPRDARGTGSVQTVPSDEALWRQCQKYQGAELEQCMQGKRGSQGKLGSETGQPPALPGPVQKRQHIDQPPG